MKRILTRNNNFLTQTICDHTESLLRNLSSVNLRRSRSINNNEFKQERVEPNEDDDDDKYRRLFCFDEAPEYLKHNVYIRNGYRGMLNTKLCMESIFWWTNETINIWSHVFGFMLFLGLTLKDSVYIDIQAPWEDKVLVANVLVCFQVCMILSSLYHTFSCRSEKDFNCFLTFDLFGIALSLLAIYTSGIYYAFWCEQYWRTFYMFTVSLIFAGAMLLQLPKFNISSNVKTLVFILWALYGVIPTIHWTIRSGGLASPVVRLLLPRVMGMYGISGLAFLVYITKIPERFFAGKFDYFGHSHQWWHIIIVMALYYWHSSGILYLEYRMNHACPGMESSSS
ncbi:progestin and adipoQ receptor family member 3 isoform X2 [Onthophagus taurus]|uniref:progestin and adipoQ receptor family member 3 isoform X2 n=1 Tax=Onthophagus taurus TaxID=166361 RepID=UPI0039BE3FDE